MVACALALHLAVAAVDPPAALLPPLRLGDAVAVEPAPAPGAAGRRLGAFALAGALAAAADAAVVGLSFAVANGGSAGAIVALAPALIAALAALPPALADLGARVVLGPAQGSAGLGAAVIAHLLVTAAVLAVAIERELEAGPALAVYCAVDFAITGAAAAIFHRPAAAFGLRPPPRPAPGDSPAARARPPPRLPLRA